MATKLATIIADFKTALATKLSAGGNSCSIQSILDDDGVTIPNGSYFFTVDGDNAQKEHIVATLTGANLTAIKSVSRQGVQTANAVREHRIGASVSITNFGHIKYLNDLLAGTTDLNSSDPLAYDADPDLTGNNKKLATVKLVEDTAMAGGADASSTVKGVTMLSVDPVSATDPIAVGDNDGRVPTTDEKAAMAGSSGTPSAANKFVTAADVVEANTVSKIPRRDANGDVLVAATPTNANAATPKNYVDTAVSGFNQNVVGVNTSGTWFTFPIPLVADAAAGTFGWVGTTTNDIFVAASSMAGLTKINADVNGVRNVFGFGKGTNTDFTVKFVGQFKAPGGDQKTAFHIGSAAQSQTWPDAGTSHCVTLYYNDTTNKMMFGTTGAAIVNSTFTDISGTCSPATLYMFEIIHTAGVSTVLKVNGTVVATHDTAANLPASNTASVFFSHLKAANATQEVGDFSSIIASIKL
jgi:hypothetical protein